MNNYQIDSTAKISENVKFIGNVKIKIGAFVVIEDNVVLNSGNNKNSSIIINNRSKIKYGTLLETFNGYIHIGIRSTIGPYCCIAGHGGVEIGNYIMIANHTSIHASSHIHQDIEQIRFQGETAKGIKIKSNCWIGMHVSILDNVTISNNTIIGAGSVVTKNMPKNSICFGIPCKKIKKRN
jgi:acetyltransferase-like isoleucine patch superfamily enzyme